MRDQQPEERVLGGRSKAQALFELRRGPGTLGELVRRTQASKSALRSALIQLEKARVIRRTGGRFELTGPGETIVTGLLALHEPATAMPSPLDPYAGQWVALDERHQVLAAAHEPKQLVANLRKRGIVATGLMRVPEPGRHVEGSLVG